MNSAHRSSLKKRPGPQDDRRVSFASPVSSSQKTAAVTVAAQTKQPAKAKNLRTMHSTPKKSKPAHDVADIISLVSKQSDILDDVSEIEHKMIKQAKMTQDLTMELANSIERIANMALAESKLSDQMEKQSKKLISLEGKTKELVEKANNWSKTLENRVDARSHHSTCLNDVQAAIKIINNAKINNDGFSEDFSAHYDKLLDLVETLEPWADKL
ncbi:Biogenesis of lysosome-related organelles complex 1 subunit 1 [Caenorhabditis elegans]|uniref:Biogenesis of lysosome-related organelles complex 1 subunit 1 n=1 Tax=Caenorhabditis elegans TaxID=6239 RepID=O76388_CAEEL|nr:Biogenesis of lysosome-related organelles complex 1 subunit 1 [Caenorhabditis elegans]CCD65128.1 Biogenesis of lysosome-related organelles complex 1 subunit 1 [Caenorhabditis elegans]|eukprot:NP_504462.1 Uncharacterized protein CELE_C24G6.1 [Caenorhabditis elegans]